jgi:hypothetical protein
MHLIIYQSVGIYRQTLNSLPPKRVSETEGRGIVSAFNGASHIFGAGQRSEMWLVASLRDFANGVNYYRFIRRVMV